MQRAIAVLDHVGVPELQTRIDWYPHEFSCGQRQRIAIAEAPACDPELIICDEAVSPLDVSIQMQVINLLADKRGRLGFSLVFITHDVPIIRRPAHHILVMKGCRAVEEQEAEMLFRNRHDDYKPTLIGAAPSCMWKVAE